MFENRKPQFIPPEKDNFERILDAELAAAKLKNPTVKLEQVLQETARKFPQAYELHARRVDGDPYASSAIASDPSPYFKKVSDIYFSELRRVDPHAQYADAAAACADAYPQLYERHVAETTGLPVIQSRVTLSDREHLPAKIGNGIILNRFSFARRAFPQLVNSRLDEMKAKDTNAKYETALKETSAHLVELYQDYVLSLSA